VDWLLAFTSLPFHTPASVGRSPTAACASAHVAPYAMMRPRGLHGLSTDALHSKRNREGVGVGVDLQAGHLMSEAVCIRLSLPTVRPITAMTIGSSTLFSFTYTSLFKLPPARPGARCAGTPGRGYHPRLESQCRGSRWRYLGPFAHLQPSLFSSSTTLA